MTDLETFIAFTLIFLPALIFWILTIAHVANKIYDAIERDKQCCDELTGYDKIVEQIKQGVCEESLADVINTLGEQKEKRDELPSFPPQTFSDLRAWEETGLLDDLFKRQEKQDELNEFTFSITGCKDEIVNKRDEYLKRNSDYEEAKYKYVEDKLNDYLNTDRATDAFTEIFGSKTTHEFKKKLWLAHLDDLRKDYEENFDNL